MACQPCEQRKANLKQMAADGTLPPKKDFAFYAVGAVATAAVGYIIYRKLKEDRHG